MWLNFHYKFLFNYLDRHIPKGKYQLLKLGNCYICIRDIDSDTSQNAISDTGTCEASINPEIVKIKTISVFVEREACKKSDVKSSTGFAAYPFIFRDAHAHQQAKIKALNELVERYALRYWAEYDGISCNISKSPEPFNKRLYIGIQREVSFSQYYKVIPAIHYHNNNFPMIILCALTEFGWIFGSAASQSVTSAEQNALKELYMSV